MGVTDERNNYLPIVHKKTKTMGKRGHIVYYHWPSVNKKRKLDGMDPHILDDVANYRNSKSSTSDYLNWTKICQYPTLARKNVAKDDIKKRYRGLKDNGCEEEEHGSWSD
jgi:hypothetical protein